MSFLSDKEREAIQASHRLSVSARARSASALVNPASGLANDYLNRFNEIVMLVEQLPYMPELIEDIMAWRPITYQEYFRTSILPGSMTALERYETLDVRFRKTFETIVAELDRRSTGSVAAVRRKFKNQKEGDAETLLVVCEKAGVNIREVLDKATMLVNHGSLVARDPVQERADAIMLEAMAG